MHVVCTAGHVDHGKSTLVRALTGMEPDRLAEEQRRGLTIELGYAWTRLDVAGEPTDVAFVDLPGHERFVPTMLSGAGALRCAVLVVAADEGWMPQSAEHLAILDLLEIDDGVVVLSRCDLVDDDTADVAEELLRDELAGSPLADAPVVRVAIPRQGPPQGLEAVRTALATSLARLPTPRPGRPRLWVDRSFTVAGAGTVVTGTLTGAALSVGDEVTLQPTGLTSRIRGLQQLGTAVQRAANGRVAVNLVGVDRAAVTRGDALVMGSWPPTGLVDVWLRAVDERPVRRRGAWHLHVGSAERLVRVEPWRGEIHRDGGYARLRLDAPLPLVAGDRIVLRESGAQATVGGGQVLDARPPARRRGEIGRSERLAALGRRRAALAGAGAGRVDLAALVAAAAAERGAITGGDLQADLDLVDPDAHATAARLVDLGGAYADPAAFGAWAAALSAQLRAFHTTSPLAAGAPRATALDVLATSGAPPSLCPLVLERLRADGVVATDGPVVRLPDHRVRVHGADAEHRDRLTAVLEADPFTPPDLAEAAARADAGPDLLRALHDDGTLVRLTSQLSWTRRAVDDAVERIRVAAADGPVTAAEVREALGSTRKHVIPLLEELDRSGVTRRVGDRREVR